MSLVFLVGVDCSKCGDRALEYAAERANVKGAKLIVAHVIEWSQYSFHTHQELEERHKRREAELSRAYEEIINPIIASLSEQGIEAEGIVRHGHVASTMNELVDEYGVTNIVVGRRGKSLLKGGLFGGVSGALVQTAEVPVTVVP